MELGDSWFSDRCTVSEDPMSDCSFPKREFPYALRYIYSVNILEMNAMFFFRKPYESALYPSP